MPFAVSRRQVRVFNLAQCDQMGAKTVAAKGQGTHIMPTVYQAEIPQLVKCAKWVKSGEAASPPP